MANRSTTALLRAFSRPFSRVSHSPYRPQFFRVSSTSKCSFRSKYLSTFHKLHSDQTISPETEAKHHRFPEFQLDGRVFIVTGGGRGLGLTLAEALVEVGGHGKQLNRT